jgi:hypothetical protein
MLAKMPRGEENLTIAACYLSSEGVVFGADSTSTMFVAGTRPGLGSDHHYNHAQKIYQIGENSTLGLTMWGLGSLGTISYRTLIAQFADTMVSTGAHSMREVADRWNEFFWTRYSEAFLPDLERARQLAAQVSRSPEEEDELEALAQAYFVGFCLGGYLMHDRTPAAFVIRFDPTLTGPKAVEAVPTGGANQLPALTQAAATTVERRT